MLERDDLLLFDADAQPMFVFDRETLAFLAVNRAACEYYGWTRDELLAMTLRDIRPAEELPRLEGELATSPQPPATKFSRLGRHVTRAGRVLDVEIAISRITFRGRAAALARVTEQTEIHEVERRFRLMVEHSADGISMFDENGIIRYVSPGAERMLGRTSAELVGQRSIAITHPDDLAHISRPSPGQAVRNLTRARHGNGSWRWVETVVTNLTKDPAVRAYVANFRDVTESQQTQRRLEFLLSATSAITYTAFAGGVGFISANVMQVLGHEPDAFLRDPTFWPTHLHPDDAGDIHEAQRRLLEVGEGSIRYRFRHADGSYRWMQDTARVIRGEGRSEIVGTWLDVTDRVEAERSLQRSEGNFRTLIERSPTATVVHVGGIVSYANPAAVVMLGYGSAEELIRTHLLEMVHVDDRALVVQRMQETDRTGRCEPAEVRLLRCDGAVVIVEAEGLLLDFDGHRAHVVLGRDVHERSQLFARMALADRMLSVGTLAAGVAHEINNPLAYVIANLDILAKRHARLEPREVTELLADAREGATRVSAIVRELRSLSRQDDDSRTAVDVLGVLASSLKLAHSELCYRARIVEAYTQPLPLVHANASRLGQVFLNLLLNAAQAIAGDAATNEIRLRAWAGEDRARVCVEIEDTGVGMSAEVQRRIFDPFFTTKPIGVGTGLGLAISHQIVTSFGGEITVESAQGRGSTFRVVLPASVDVSPPPPPRAAAGVRVGARVLMIDDEPAVARATRLLLAPEHDVVAVTRAAEALARLHAGEQYDVILCDLVMPEISGIELYEQLAQRAPDYLRRIVFVSGGAFTAPVRDFLATVANPLLEKPFTEQALRAAIEKILAP